MKGRKDNFKVSGMMILTVILVFAVLAAVTLAFEMLQRRQEKKYPLQKIHHKMKLLWRLVMKLPERMRYLPRKRIELILKIRIVR